MTHRQQNRHIYKHEYASRKLPRGVCKIFNIARIADQRMVCDGITGKYIQNIAQKNKKEDKKMDSLAL